MFGDWWNTDIAWMLTFVIQLAYLCISVALTIHILLHKSDPKASLMWIALIWFAPIFGAVFYLLFGINRITRRAQRLLLKSKTSFQTTKVTNDLNFADDPWIEFRRLGNNVTHSRRSAGNEIAALEGVELIHSSMIESIQSSERTVMLTTYIFRRDEFGQALAKALIAADQRGVDVKVLLDGVGNGLFRSKTYRELKRGGVEVKRFLFSVWPWRMPLMNLRSHRKLLIIDKSVVFTGSMNIGKVKNLETHFKISGPVVGDALEAFAFDWQLSGGGSLADDFRDDTIREVGPVAARGILSGPVYERERLRWVVLGALGAAKNNIRIVTPYFIPDQGLLAGLILAALKGVRVEILLPKKSNYFFADWASHHQIMELLRAGCHIYHRPDIFDHSKLMTIDGHWALLGSSNWDARSLRLNFEFDIECENTEFVTKLDRLIVNRVSKSERLSIDSFESRPLFVKLRDSAARLLLPYL